MSRRGVRGAVEKELVVMRCAARLSACVAWLRP